MHTIRRLVVLLVVIAACVPTVHAEGRRASVREYRKAIRTYPFSDPSPIAVVGRIYPYFRFEGYTDTPADREWTVVELENDYLKVAVLPQIGGKIWSAIEKSTGRSFIYENHVVKFRDIAMRGPWTSGGIEPNYGIIGHTPNCATPVDYAWRVDEDGTARVTIGVLDLLTRTPWRLEIALPSDKAYFTTTSYWYNATPIEQPYYTWMNAGIKAAGNLELIYPGTHYIGHGGEVFPWPIHPGNGKNLAFYEQNDFGPYKSYHVLGRHSDFFGAYWHEDEFGMGRYSTRDDKVGKKAWIWGLSRQGMIWEQLLTDTDGQYVEVQSGRLFNQAAEASTLTPFKHRGFEPHSFDSWREYWFPVKGTKGFVAANEFGALNVVSEPRPPGRLEIRFSPLQRIRDRLDVLDGDRVVFSAPVALEPMQVWSQTLEKVVPRERLRVRIGGLIEYSAGGGDELSRPLEAPKEFDWDSVQGLWLRGKEWLRQRDYVQAEAALQACLQKDPNYLPALADLALARYRAMDYRKAWDLARRGLAVDTYDPASNYYYALASVRLGRTVDALDGFEVAATDPRYRAAAWTELARLYLRSGDLVKAEFYSTRALAGQAHEGQEYGEPFQLLLVIDRLKRAQDAGASAAAPALRAASAADPLAHAARFEAYLLDPTDARRRAFVDGIRNEMPHQTFLELAAWYLGLRRLDEARRVLELAPPQAEVLYWLAYVEALIEGKAGALPHTRSSPGAPTGVARSSSDVARSSSDVARSPSDVARSSSDVTRSSSFALTLQRAEAASPQLVFPFRPESADVFEWAMTRSSGWRPKYYLALILWSRNEMTRARQLLDECGALPDFAPFYAARSKAFEAISRERSMADLGRAAELDPGEWRYGKLIVEHHLEEGRYDKAFETASRYYKQSPDNYILGMLLAKSMVRADRAAEAAAMLARLKVLPYEGATEGRSLYREAQLLLGAQAWREGRISEAMRRVAAAREWPENLGAGKPYPEDTDERLEDWLEAQCLERSGRVNEAIRLRERAQKASRRAAAGQWPRVGASAVESRILAAWK